LGLSSVLSGVSWAQYLFYVTKQHRTLWRCREVYVSVVYGDRTTLEKLLPVLSKWAHHLFNSNVIYFLISLY
jgi:hypothetical protein